MSSDQTAWCLLLVTCAGPEQITQLNFDNFRYFDISFKPFQSLVRLPVISQYRTRHLEQFWEFDSCLNAYGILRNAPTRRNLRGSLTRGTTWQIETNKIIDKKKLQGIDALPIAARIIARDGDHTTYLIAIPNYKPNKLPPRLFLI